MKTTGLVIVLLSLVLIGVGCSRQNEQQQPVGLNYWELPDSAVVVKVNEFQLTKAENERRIGLRMALLQAKGRKFDARQKRDLRARLLRCCPKITFTHLRNWCGKTERKRLAPPQ